MGELQYASKYNGETVPDNNGLEECEQEFCIYFSSQTAETGIAEVGSHVPEITRALLKSKYFKLRENGLELSTHKKPRVIGVSGSIPIQSLLIKSPRKSDALRNIVAIK